MILSRPGCILPPLAELNFQSFEQRVAITYTLEGMQQIAQELAGFPGRKYVTWAGGRLPFSVSDNSMQLAPANLDSLAGMLPMYEHTRQLLNDAQISLYPVDVKGLQVLTILSASACNPGKNFGCHMNFKQSDTLATLQTLASATGPAHVSTPIVEQLNCNCPEELDLPDREWK